MLYFGRVGGFDLFDDEIDAIRDFDPDSQISENKLDRVLSTIWDIQLITTVQGLSTGIGNTQHMSAGTGIRVTVHCSTVTKPEVTKLQTRLTTTL